MSPFRPVARAHTRRRRTEARQPRGARHTTAATMRRSTASDVVGLRKNAAGWKSTPWFGSRRHGLEVDATVWKVTSRVGSRRHGLEVDATVWKVTAVPLRRVRDERRGSPPPRRRAGALPSFVPTRPPTAFERRAVSHRVGEDAVHYITFNYALHITLHITHYITHYITYYITLHYITLLHRVSEDADGRAARRRCEREERDAEPRKLRRVLGLEDEREVLNSSSRYIGGYYS